ncbi:MAG: proteasome ATPase, partial [Acidimicrobiaceae bacterium]|nr:proteasome ATPase [Acidimicrobiaceae bacterium]
MADDTGARLRAIEERLLDAKGQLATAKAQNEKLSYALREARDHVASLREEVEKLTQPPSAYGIVLGANDDGTVDVLTNSRKMRVSLHPGIDVTTLERGSEVVLNESLNVVLT